MGKSNQNRVTIPMWMREEAKLKLGEQYYLIFIKKNEILLSPEANGKVIGKIKLDEKGRFFFPAEIQNVFSTERILIYLDGEKIGMLFLDGGA